MRFLLGLLLLSAPALACGPDFCGHPAPCLAYAGNVDEPDESGLGVSCRPSLPHLDPENYTEQNAELLFHEYFGFDLAPISPGDGCDSNSEANEKLFAGWVDSEKGEKAEKDQLTALRHEVKAAGCFTKDRATEFLAKLAAFPARVREAALGSYLKGVILFYSHQYNEARQAFAAASGAGKPYSETLAYLTARTALLEGQEKWDGYAQPGSNAPPPLDEAKIKAAREALESYRRQYPHGAYETSAEGLLRRAAYLLKDEASYSSLFDTAFNRALETKDAAASARLFAEGESRAPYGKDAAHVHAVFRVLRSFFVQRQFLAPTGEHGTAAEELKLLEGAKASFDSFPSLYAFTRANLLLGLNRYQEALEQLPAKKIDSTREWGYSWAVLKARILVGQKKFAEARELVRPFPDKTFFTYTYLWEGKPEAAFTPDVAANADTLSLFARRAIPTERMLGATKSGTNEELNAALAYRLLFQRRFAELAKILPGLRVPTLTPDLRAAVAKLAKGTDPASLVSVADFLKDQPRDLLDYQVCTPEAQEPPAYWPIQLYQEAIASFPENAKNDAQARALFAAIHCYGERATSSCYNVDSENAKHAGGSVSLATRKAWFKLLHSKYKGSRYAKDTRIFW